MKEGQRIDRICMEEIRWGDIPDKAYNMRRILEGAWVIVCWDCVMHMCVCGEG